MPKEIASKDKHIAETLGLDNRIEVSACRDSFITLKDHKPDFKNNPTYRLLNPSKSEISIVSKTILDGINTKIIQATKVNLWRSTNNAIEWFKTIPDKQKHAFITFDTRARNNFFTNYVYYGLCNDLKWLADIDYLQR